MELAYAFFAKAAQFSDDGLLGIIGGDLQSLYGSIPFKADALTLVTKVEFSAEESGRPHAFHLETIHPDGRTLVGEPLEVIPPHPGRQDRIGAIILFDLADTSFDRPGTFRFRLLMDGTPLKTLELAIYAEQVEAEPAATT
jgi:hypothetical protein